MNKFINGKIKEYNKYFIQQCSNGEITADVPPKKIRVWLKKTFLIFEEQTKQQIIKEIEETKKSFERLMKEPKEIEFMLHMYNQRKEMCTEIINKIKEM